MECRCLVVELRLNAEQTTALQTWATARGLHVIGEPEVNRYNPPWTPWFLRRNEVWMTLADAGSLR